MGQKEKQLVQKAVDRWPNQVEYLGPTYGNAKSQFYANIDVFLFPSESESWGIVLTEAMSVGCPVIANDRGCISHLLQGECGLLVLREEEFVAKAVTKIQEWVDNKKLYAMARQQTLVRFQQLEQEANDQLPRFVMALRNFPN